MHKNLAEGKDWAYSKYSVNELLYSWNCKVTCEGTLTTILSV